MLRRTRAVFRSLEVLGIALLLGGAGGAAAEPASECADPLGFSHLSHLSHLSHFSYLSQSTRVGLEVQPMTAELREFFRAPRDEGLLVVGVEAGRPAAKAGVQVGDVVVRAGGRALRRPVDLLREVARAPAAQPLALRVVRDGEEIPLAVVPDGEALSWADPRHWRHWSDWGDWSGWIERGVRRGRDELSQQLEELERRFRELERGLNEQRKRLDEFKTHS